MMTFVMLTRLSPEALRSPQSLEDLERKIKEQVDGFRGRLTSLGTSL